MITGQGAEVVMVFLCWARRRRYGRQGARREVEINGEARGSEWV